MRPLARQLTGRIREWLRVFECQLLTMGVAAMYVSVNETQYRLELFDGKAYRVAATGTLRELEPATDAARADGNKSRRITLAAKDRPAMPKYRKPPRASINAGRSVQGTMQAYLAWANRAGLKAVTFYDDSLGHGYARTCGKAVKFVDVADFLGEAPQAEPDDDELRLAA